MTLITIDYYNYCSRISSVPTITILNIVYLTISLELVVCLLSFDFFHKQEQ